MIYSSFSVKRRVLLTVSAIMFCSLLRMYCVYAGPGGDQGACSGNGRGGREDQADAKRGGEDGARTPPLRYPPWGNVFNIYIHRCRRQPRNCQYIQDTPSLFYIRERPSIFYVTRVEQRTS